MIPKRAIVILLATLLLGADRPKADAAKVIKKFQGTWALVSLENNGTVEAAENLKGRKLIVKDDGAVFMQGDEVFSRSMQKLDVKTSPKQIDATQTEDRKRGNAPKEFTASTGTTWRSATPTPPRVAPASSRREKTPAASC